jgi:hypothetical protein
MLFQLDQPPFAARTGRGVRVAVIDSGIQAPHPHVAEVKGGVAIVIDPAADGGLRVDDGAFADRIGHGTAVAAAIHEKAPLAELLAVKVFDARLATSALVLARAIEVAVERGAHLINLSLGTENGAHRVLLERPVRAAAARGALVVAALESDGAPCYPGALPGVVAVKMDLACPREELRLAEDGERVAFVASSHPRPIPGVPQERNLSGISFAVANVTGFLARLCEGASSASLDGVVALLRASRS